MLGGLYILKMKSDHLPGLLEPCPCQWHSPFANKLHLTVKRAPDFWARPPAMTYVNSPVLRLAPHFVMLTGTLEPLQGTITRSSKRTLDSRFFFLPLLLPGCPASRFSFPLPYSHRDMWPHYSSKAKCQPQTETSGTVLQDTCFSLCKLIVSDISHGDIKLTDPPAKLLSWKGAGIYMLK